MSCFHHLAKLDNDLLFVQPGVRKKLVMNCLFPHPRVLQCLKKSQFPPEVHVGIVLLAKTFAVNHPFLRVHQPAWSGCRICSMHQPGFPAQLFGYFEDPALESDVYGKEESDECISNLLQNELTYSAHGHKVKNINYYFVFL